MRKGMFSVLRKANLMSFFFFKGGRKNLLSHKNEKKREKKENKNVVIKTHLKNLGLLVQKKS